MLVATEAVRSGRVEVTPEDNLKRLAEDTARADNISIEEAAKRLSHQLIDDTERTEIIGPSESLLGVMGEEEDVAR